MADIKFPLFFKYDKVVYQNYVFAIMQKLTATSVKKEDIEESIKMLSFLKESDMFNKVDNITSTDEIAA